MQCLQAKEPQCGFPKNQMGRYYTAIFLHVPILLTCPAQLHASRRTILGGNIFLQPQLLAPHGLSNELDIGPIHR